MSGQWVIEDSQPTGKWVVEDAPVEKPRQGAIEWIKSANRNLGAGMLKGATDIGTTLLYPLDELGITGKTNKERKAAIDQYFKENADPESTSFKTGALTSQIAGTAGAGGLLGNAVGGLSKFAPAVAPMVANSLRSGGMTIGVPPAASILSREAARNAAIRVGGGAVSGGVMSGLVNPEDAGTGAVIGGAIPIVAKTSGVIGSEIGKVIRGTPNTPDTLQAIKQARDLGYVIPPSQAKPSLANRFIEGFSGKISTAQNASARNAGVTESLAAKSLGLAPDTKITPDVLTDLRKTAGNAYNAIGQTGTITPAQSYTQALDNIAAPFIKTSQGFPNAKVSPVIDLVESLKSPSFDSASAVEKIKQLRTAADDAFRSGNTDIARASKAAASALEDAVENHLYSVGAPELLQNFRDARQLIAKTYTVEKALNPTTGSVDARKLGAMIKRGKPLNEELKQAGDFANRFPKANQPVETMGSLPQASPLDWAVSGGVSAGMGNPLYLAGVAARPVARKLALSDLVQNRLSTPVSQINADDIRRLLESPVTRAGLLSAQSR